MHRVCVVHMRLKHGAIIAAGQSCTGGSEWQRVSHLLPPIGRWHGRPRPTTESGEKHVWHATIVVTFIYNTGRFVGQRRASGGESVRLFGHIACGQPVAEGVAARWCGTGMWHGRRWPVRSVQCAASRHLSH
jgi:hypothetical protein